MEPKSNEPKPIEGIAPFKRAPLRMPDTEIEKATKTEYISSDWIPVEGIGILELDVLRPMDPSRPTEGDFTNLITPPATTIDSQGKLTSENQQESFEKGYYSLDSITLLSQSDLTPIAHIELEDGTPLGEMEFDLTFDTIEDLFMDDQEEIDKLMKLGKFNDDKEVWSYRGTSYNPILLPYDKLSKIRIRMENQGGDSE